MFESQPGFAVRPFWKEQFAPQVTGRQRVFDIVFGVVAPIGSFIGDPIFFREGNYLSLGPLFGEFQFFVYLTSAIQIAALSGWLLLRDRLVNGTLIGGVLFGGAFFSGAMGVLLLPFSLIGLIYLIGVLGFIPFFTAFVYLRNGWRAIRPNQFVMERVAAIVLLVILVVGGPATIAVVAHKVMVSAVWTIVDGSDLQAKLAADELHWLRHFVWFDKLTLFDAHQREQDEKRRERIRNAYFALTGESLERSRPAFD